MECSPTTDSLTLDLPSKLLHRFYEPLGLLFALGTARGEHTHKTLPSFDLADLLTAQQLRRQYLDELTFLCDYEKGGDSCTAIALGQTPQNLVFWVAANKCPKRLIVPFLHRLLKILADAQEEGNGEQLTQDIFEISVDFAHERIRTYTRYLLQALDKLSEFSIGKEEPMSVFITIWQEKLQELGEQNLHLLVDFAYTNRHSEFMRRLADLTHEQRYKSSQDSLQSTCASIRHQIGRLGLHARSAKALASYAPRIVALLDSYTVQAVPTSAERNIRPPPREATDVHNALKRMLPANAPELEECRQALAVMDEPFKISKRFKEDYANPRNKTKIHAELKVLHYFDQHDEEFAEGDKYIACSKPACFCCHLYFRYHPGKFVEPRSHHKIYLNWQPPGIQSLSIGKGSILRGILIRMIEDIRGDALMQLLSRAAPRSYHPDSVTGISFPVSAALELESLSLAGYDEREGDARDDSSGEFSTLRSQNETHSFSSPALSTVYDDTDEDEGGVSLLGIV